MALVGNSFFRGTSGLNARELNLSHSISISDFVKIDENGRVMAFYGWSKAVAMAILVLPITSGFDILAIKSYRLMIFCKSWNPENCLFFTCSNYPHNFVFRGLSYEEFLNLNLKWHYLMHVWAIAIFGLLLWSIPFFRKNGGKLPPKLFYSFLTYV